ncbi:hypothetical protein [Paraburkholderia sp.]|uniref:hypothetical protein n=1 Tax=Paraburkholderia sp. TaxID=1926495 RepID=UPI0039E23768
MKLVGLTKEAAIEALKKAGCTWRVMHEDGKAFLGTADVQHRRCNLTIEKGVVTRATFG